MPGLSTELALGALQDGIRMRRPPPGLIHHSDRGGHYAGKRFWSTLRRADDCYDNAFMESCFGTIKTEL